ESVPERPRVCVHIFPPKSVFMRVHVSCVCVCVLGLLSVCTCVFVCVLSAEHLCVCVCVCVRSAEYQQASQGEGSNCLSRSAQVWSWNVSSIFPFFIVSCFLRRKE